MRGNLNRYVYGDASKAAAIDLTKAVAADFIRREGALHRHLPWHE